MRIPSILPIGLTSPDPEGDRNGAKPYEGIGAILYLVRVLFGHSLRLFETVKTRSKTPQFNSIAVRYGTYDTELILARVQRGILRLLALEAYLEKRVQRRRELKYTDPYEGKFVDLQDILAETPAGSPAETPVEKPAKAKAEAKQPRQARPAYDPESYYIPTMAELEKEVRSNPVGRTLTRCALDLIVFPGFCTGNLWNTVQDTVMQCGGSLSTLFRIRKLRERAFISHFDTRPANWHWDWRDDTRERMREALGYWIGDPDTIEAPKIPIVFPA